MSGMNQYRVSAAARSDLNEADPVPHGGTYDQDDATGFIWLNSLRLKAAAKVHGKNK